MARVTVEGSSTPCVDLPTGQRKTVEYTRGVRDRIYRWGYYLVVDGPTEDADTPAAVLAEASASPAAPPTDDHPDVAVHDHEPLASPPAGNASGAEWAAFLRVRGIGVPDGAGRDVMRELWRQTQVADGAR